MVTCWRYRRDIDAELDGALTTERRRRLEAHLQHCAECSEELVSARRLQLLLASYGNVDARPGFEARFWARAHSVSAGEADERLSSWLPAAGRAAAGLALALAVGFGVGLVGASSTAGDDPADVEGLVVASLQDELTRPWPAGE